jgi:hypothetical protein
MITYVWAGRHHELALIEPDEEEEEGWLDEDAANEKRLAGETGEEEEGAGAPAGSWEKRERRPVILYAPLISGLAMILTFLFVGGGMRKCITEPADIRSTHQRSLARRVVSPLRPSLYNSFRLPPRYRECSQCSR